MVLTVVETVGFETGDVASFFLSNTTHVEKYRIYIQKYESYFCLNLAFEGTEIGRREISAY